MKKNTQLKLINLNKSAPKKPKFRQSQKIEDNNQEIENLEWDIQKLKRQIYSLKQENEMIILNQKDPSFFKEKVNKIDTQNKRHELIKQAFANAGLDYQTQTVHCSDHNGLFFVVTSYHIKNEPDQIMTAVASGFNFEYDTPLYLMFQATFDSMNHVLASTSSHIQEPSSKFLNAQPKNSLQEMTEYVKAAYLEFNPSEQIAPQVETSNILALLLSKIHGFKNC